MECQKGKSFWWAAFRLIPNLQGAARLHNGSGTQFGDRKRFASVLYNSGAVECESSKSPEKLVKISDSSLFGGDHIALDKQKLT